MYSGYYMVQGSQEILTLRGLDFTEITV